MPLDQLIEQLYARRRFGIRPGLDRVTALLERLGNPHLSFKSIHVVGTNGKGSTSAFLSSILTCAGHRTALFTSPHLVHFNERFRINEQDIPTQQLESALYHVLEQAPEDATFFEVVTALAAVLFAETGIEIAVMEAGMGGRSDATAILPSLMTLITPISIDHSDYLGSTAAEIAAEKAGIIKPKTVVVSALQHESALKEISRNCREQNTPLFLADRDFSAAWNPHRLLDYNGIHANMVNLKPGIPGSYQSQNAAVALAAAELLNGKGVTVAPEAFMHGISKARWPGRMELIKGRPPLLLDGAHNPAGAEALSLALKDYNYRRLQVVTGIMADKDVTAILSPLAAMADRVYCVSPAVERAMEAHQLAEKTTELGMRSTACGSVAAGIAAARSDAGPEDLILVCGSLFTVGEAKALLSGTEYKGIRG